MEEKRTVPFKILIIGISHAINSSVYNSEQLQYVCCVMDPSGQTDSPAQLITGGLHSNEQLQTAKH